MPILKLVKCINLKSLGHLLTFLRHKRITGLNRGHMRSYHRNFGKGPCARGGQPRLSFSLHLMATSGSPVKHLRGSSLHRHVEIAHIALSLSLPRSLSPRILPHINSLAEQQQQLLQHPSLPAWGAASSPARRNIRTEGTHHPSDATASLPFRQQILGVDSEGRRKKNASATETSTAHEDV